MNSRHSRILERVAAAGEVSVDGLAGQLGVSVMTIRRDLAFLSQAGKLSRTHGGAMLSTGGVVEFAFHEREDRHTAEKRAIAREIAGLVTPGMAISLDTGTTVLEVARAIAGIRGLTVLTSSLAVASVLHANENIELVLLGGTVRKTSPDLTGPVTEDNLKRFRVHLAVLGADAVTPDGIFTTDVGVSRISRAMIESADKVAVAVDFSKFTQTGFVRCAALSDVDYLVTDEACPAAVRAWLGKAAKKVSYARV